MRITEDVRRYAKEQGITEEAAIEEGLKQKATEFAKSGSEIAVAASLCRGVPFPVANFISDCTNRAAPPDRSGLRAVDIPTLAHISPPSPKSIARGKRLRESVA